jgi:mono/diheme cytochrome c family protein
MNCLPLFANPNLKIIDLKVLSLCLCVSVAGMLGCDVEVRKTNAQLGLNPQQAAGRRLYDAHCDRCHEPYSSRSKKGRSLKGVFGKQYLPQSGLPANDQQVGDIIHYGRNMMPAFGQELTQQQLQELLAYLHTL